MRRGRSPYSVAHSVTTTDAPPRVQALAPWLNVPANLIDGNEIVLLSVKPSMWRPLFEAVPWLIAGAALATAALSFQRAVPGLSVRVTAQALASIGFIRLGVAIIRWVPQWYLLTNRRIIHLDGVRTLRVTSCPLLDLRNTCVVASIGERIIGLGTIHFLAGEPAPHAVPPWISVPEPDAVHARIRRAIENSLDGVG